MNPGTHREFEKFPVPTPSVAKDLMPRDIMSSEPRHCTGMTNWPNTIQCLGSDNIMSLGIKSSKNPGPIFLGENSLEQRSQKLGASRNLGLLSGETNSPEHASQ